MSVGASNKIFPQGDAEINSAAGGKGRPGGEGCGPFCCSHRGACLSAFLLLLTAMLAALLVVATILGRPPHGPETHSCVTLTNRTGFLCHDRRHCIPAHGVCDGVRTCPHALWSFLRHHFCVAMPSQALLLYTEGSFTVLSLLSLCGHPSRQSSQAVSSWEPSLSPAGGVNNSFFFNIYLYIVYTTFLPCMLACQKRAPDLITSGCEPPCGCGELNSGPPEEQSVLLTSETSLQPLNSSSLGSYRPCLPALTLVTLASHWPPPSGCDCLWQSVPVHGTRVFRTACWMNEQVNE
ncbi:low-density lipoprotein receptor class A domain-containing protein 1 isoform X1 [Alexandromys fortis]|uniref:low-density lipoprotein receptor class A domain-containing protein 1 isoform X1 n=1 Tax=Alexandromys fortis TaxID=100897 RepID=UPI002152497E|nr:low-density lipoprotein receptor class A domain-containing protein 1 isoform X1 [Microtus fortis]